jgi:hypothetical protein
MKSREMSMDHKPYSIRLMMQDLAIVLSPSLLLLIGFLWVFRNEWSLVWLGRVLASFLSFS